MRAELLTDLEQYDTQLRLVMRCIVGVLLLMCTTVHAGTAYLGQLQARVERLQLANTNAWHALLHYEANWLQASVTSTVITEWFFLAPNGRAHPSAELRATLAAFVTGRNIPERKEPARCVFPGRYAFLDRHLHFDAARMPHVSCEQYQHWQSQLDADSISLVFPAAYMNNPASMFGHTLLRIDSADRAAKDKLLSHAVNFAADTEASSGLIFAFKGLTGGYPGSYGIAPFYEKVKEYAWIENRDLWSYPLALPPQELDRLVAHLWAMRGVSFTYYFFTKNCSYQLLALLQTANPKWHFTESFDWYAIPAETIRRLARVPGLLGEPSYRPALATRLRQHAGLMTEQQVELALAIAAGRKAPDAQALASPSSRTRVRVLELAYDYLYYQNQVDGELKQAAAARAGRILLARSRIQADSGFPPVPAPSVSPAEGHDTRRVALGFIHEDDVTNLGLWLRPIYHDLLDPPGGYTTGAQISALALRLRLAPERGELELSHFTLLEITSISPRGPLFKPVSWRVSSGLRQRPVSAPMADDAHLGFYLQGGPGLAWGDADQLVLYTFGLGSLDINHGFDQGYALGAGVSAGVLAYPVPGWQLRVETGVIDYVAGDHGRRVWLSLTQQWQLIPDLALRVGIGYHDTMRKDFGRAMVMLQGYF